MASNVIDLFAWNRALMTRSIINDQNVRLMFSDAARVDPLTYYGMGWFMDRSRPGVVIDPGAYGAMAWLDNERGFAAFFALESDSDTGHELRRETMPILEAVFDEAP